MSRVKISAPWAKKAQNGDENGGFFMTGTMTSLVCNGTDRWFTAFIKLQF